MPPSLELRGKSQNKEQKICKSQENREKAHEMLSSRYNIAIGKRKKHNGCLTLGYKRPKD